jgi:hypothetical protein
MRTLETIRFRSCQPIGQMLAKYLHDNFYEKARSHGILMTIWLDKELSGDLYVHLENKPNHGTKQQDNQLGLSIEKELETHGLVTSFIIGCFKRLMRLALMWGQMSKAGYHQYLP